MSKQRPDDQEIRKTLVELHDELERTQTLDEDEQKMMRHLMADIQEMLKRADAAKTPGYRANRPFLNRLEQSIDMLETDHPTLTVMIEKALDTLNLAGI